MGLRCSTPLPEHLRNTDDTAEREADEPEDQKKSFLTSATERTKNLQHKLSSGASHLRTKFKRVKKPKVESPKTSPRNSLKLSPKESKKFKGPEFSKLKNFHLPKISKPDFKRPEFTKFKRPDFKMHMPEFSKVPQKLGISRSKSLKESTVSTQESVETGTTGTEETPVKQTPKKRFEFGSYPKIFDRFRKQSRDESTSESRPEEDRDEGTPPVQFATVPRTAKTKSRNIISARWARKPETSLTDSESGKYHRYNSEGDSVDRETSLERRMRVALKNSMEDEEEPLGILQTDEQKQFAEYNEENRAIHEISRAREDEFHRRKPLVHQESDLVSDLVSEESNREFDWVECEQLRERLVAQRSNDLSGSEKNALQDTDLFASNVSNQETQSSGSSSHRRRTGVIEEIDDDEFFLRRKGISQDNIRIGEYISSAIRDGLDETPANALEQIDGYDRYYDENFNISNEQVNYGYDVPPRKPKRFTKNFDKSLESEEFNQDVDSRQSFDDGNDFYQPDRPTRKERKRYDSDVDGEVPVAAEYYPRYDDEGGSFYENEYMEGIEQPNILVTNIDPDESECESHLNDVPLARQATPPTPPKAPKRRRKLRDSAGRDSSDHLKNRSVSNRFLPNGNNEEVSLETKCQKILLDLMARCYVEH